ncbi:hypothetical protein AB6806_04730 [Bosea sp. RCC_152_1]|uniref:hypothetical protein n=1 Tax=Bosea sp. RCC_152_1 TaxID=3239228 RepID=UPI003525D9ED
MQGAKIEFPADKANKTKTGYFMTQDNKATLSADRAMELAQRSRNDPLSRFAIPQNEVDHYRMVAAQSGRLDDLINELISLDALIEAKRGRIEPDVLTGMELTYDLVLLQVAAMEPATEPSALLKWSILDYQPKTKAFGNLPEFLVGQQQRLRKSLGIRAWESEHCDTDCVETLPAICALSNEDPVPATNETAERGDDSASS